MFRKQELEFLGHIVSPDGILPAATKMDAIQTFRTPKNESEVRSFLGLANYMNKFICNLATIDEPLRRLTLKNTLFEWTEEHTDAFERIKQGMREAGKLGYFNVNDRTVVTADASPVGLGAILAQYDSNGQIRVINYASKSLTDTETRYCQTEKEALALVWAVERFQRYLIGRSFDLVTDCKALQFLFTTRSRPCARIERWVLRLQSFDYKIVHIAGESNAADALSRLATLYPTPFDQSEELMIREVAVSSANALALNWQQIEDASKEDEEIQNIIVLLGSNRQRELPIPYRVIANELCQVGDVLMRVDRLVIPSKLRPVVLSLAHEGHPGSRMMKSHLRSSVWWPKLDQQVDEYVRNCRGCCLVSAPDAPEPMIRKTLPSGPWEDIAVDFMGPLPEGQYLLVVVDYYSRFVEVKEMNSISASDTIQELSVIFSRYGIPNTLRADNGPQLSEHCEELNIFCRENGIKLVNTIPYWPQQNGEVERQNRSILKRLKISQELGKDWRRVLSQYLLVYHSTNHSTTGKSPAELMFGRRIRNKLPHVPLYRLDDEETRENDMAHKEKGKEYADGKRKAKSSEIAVGDTVLTKRMKKTNKLDTDFCNEEYIVTRREGSDCTIESKESGKQYRRNVSHLKQAVGANQSKSIPENCEVREGMQKNNGEFDKPEELHTHRNRNEITEKRIRNEPHYFKDYIAH